MTPLISSDFKNTIIYWFIFDMKLIWKIFTVGIMVSGEEEDYPKELIRLNSQLGWCGTSTGKN